MSMSFNGPNGWIEQRWIVYALLRDNVQHHVEGGSPTKEFEGLHSLAAALGGTRVIVPAKQLRAELLRAKEALPHRPVSDLAVSFRTRAVLALRSPLPDRNETTLVSDWGGSIPMLGGTAKTLDDVFGFLLDGLLRITEGASDTDEVEVIDL